ncbi:MAG: ATP-binding cassette domain-containing protein [Clostridium sp.]
MFKINNLTKNYGERNILKDVNYEFRNKGIVCLLGPSGSGKTTLLNILSGFDNNYSGEVLVCDTSLTKMSNEELCEYRRDNVGFVFQNYNLLKGYTVLENVLLPTKLNKLDEIKNNEKARALIERVGLLDKIDENIENLSGGQKQRVSIARALINNPKIIFADEPTGALDRNNSNEVMKMLKEISKECLVVLITHDKSLCSFSDEIIYINEGQIVVQERKEEENGENKKIICGNEPSKFPPFSLSIKNFKIYLTHNIFISLAISIGVLAFILSLSSNNVIEKSIEEFKGKNTAFNNGYIIGKDEDNILSLLKEDNRIENVYYQYMLENISLNFKGNIQTMEEKFPMPKATETMAYGIMPRAEKNEIAITPSFGRKFSNNISSLIGERLSLEYNGKKYELTISGIYNGTYDDFFVSSDIEKKLYEGVEKPNYSISYDVKEFGDVVEVNDMLNSKNIDSKNASQEIEVLEKFFNNITKLFFLISILILVIGIFITSVLIGKLQSSRRNEGELLQALGFTEGNIRSVVIFENIILSAMAGSFNLVLLAISYGVISAIGLALSISLWQVCISTLISVITVLLISVIVSKK